MPTLQLPSEHPRQSLVSGNYLPVTNFIFASVVKGQGANMLKIGTKRRRTQAQIKEDEAEEIIKLEDHESKLAELANLRARVQEAEQ